MAEVWRELIFRLLLTTCRKVEILHNFILKMRAVARRKLLILLRLWKWGEGRGKKEGGRRKKEEGRRKKEEGRRKKGNAVRAIFSAIKNVLTFLPVTIN